LHKLYGEERLQKLKSQFKKKKSLFENKIMSLNRLSKHIIRYILTLKDESDEIGYTFIKLIFGKLAANQFKLMGINDSLRSEKSQLIDYLDKVMNQENIEAKETTDPLLPSQKTKIFKSKNNDPQLQKENFQNLKKCLRKKINYLINNEFDEIIFDKFVDLKIPEDYIEHWFWLKYYLKFKNDKFVNFNDLLIDVYCDDSKLQHYINSNILQEMINSNHEGYHLPVIEERCN
jgi:hypothetical protein